jgi:hypothetical protein
MLGQRPRAVGIDDDFRQMAVVIGVALAGIAVEVLAIGLEGRVLGGDRGVRLVFLAGEMRVPGERLAPQVVQRPWALVASTASYFTSLSAPVCLSWSRVSTAICAGSWP